MRKFLREWCPNWLHAIYAKTKFRVRFYFNPQSIANEFHRGIIGCDINWEHPQTLNEKINWMKFYGDTSQWPLLADKVRVRGYVKDRIGESVLPKLYGAWENAGDIDYRNLPHRFVLKTNHGCGMVVPVEERELLDKEETTKKLNKWLEQRYGYETMEPHYLKIQPLVYAEEYIENTSRFSSSLVDYKVFCLSGKPYCILVCTDRVIGLHTNLSFYDCGWNYIPDILSGKHRDEGKLIPKPDCLQQMLEYAEKLAEGHPQVRVDFYIVKGRVLFGEMTFTSQGGYMDYISHEYDLKMGKLISLP